jgi:hypothetical protein
MRDDLLDARAAINWADSQVPLLQDALDKWQQSRPYRLARERDPNGPYHLVVAYEEKPFPLTFNAWVGAILNSLRSSLDLLAATLAQRNGVTPDSDCHFPIFASELDMIDPLHGLDSRKRKQRFSDHDRAAIKALKPYKGGDESLWRLHHLDIVRKHERLVSAKPGIHGIINLGNARLLPWVATAIERGNYKTVLGRMPISASVPITEGNTFLTLDIFLNEPTLGMVDEQIFPMLLSLRLRVSDVINLFDK